MLKAIQLTSCLFFILCSCLAQDQHTTLIKKRIKLVEEGLSLPIIINQDQKRFTLEDRMKFHNVQGVSIAVINKGKIEWAKTYGYADKKKQRRLNPGTLFQAGSISKPIAALSTLLYTEQNKISLDKNINEYLKSFQLAPNKEFLSPNITIEKILSHTAGFNIHGFMGYKKGAPLPTLLQILNGTSPSNSDKLKIIHKPGSKWKYSGGGYVLLQQLLEDLSGKRFGQLAHEQLFKKLNMMRSYYQHPLNEVIFKDISHAYNEHGEAIEGNYRVHPELMAAGLWTTPYDLATVLLEVQKALKGTSSLISKPLAKKMLTERKNNWSLGWALSGKKDHRLFGHGGRNVGFTCDMLASFDKDYGVVIMTNSDMGFGLIKEIIRSVSSVYAWGTHYPKNKTIYPLSKTALKTFCGTFKSTDPEDNKQIEITMSDDKLKVLLWNQKVYYLYPESKTHFFEMNDKLDFEYKMNNKQGVQLTVNDRYHFKKL